MPNPYFQFKQFTVFHDRCAMKVTTDACLFGAWCAEKIKKEQKPGDRILDIGTGSGLLSLMIAQKNKNSIDAIEIDDCTAQQAKENIEASPWKEQIKIHHCNVLDFTKKRYDIIISNPPFYEKELMSVDEKRNEAHHSKKLKLSELITFIKSQLTPDGNFYLLLPSKRKKEAEEFLRTEELFIEKQILVSPSILHQPFRIMIRGGHGSFAIEEKKIFIKDEDGSYSDEFLRLLKDYYLYL
jgi:tRNA1Val (adenine37-N6)-methyltransferase